MTSLQTLSSQASSLKTVDASLLIAGFENPVAQCQQAFRQLLSATSEPGTLQTMVATDAQPAGLNTASWSLALSLFDADCTVWLSPVLAAQPALVSNLLFHCQTRLVEHADEADFALCNADELDTLQPFSFGSAEYPATSTSLILQVPALSDECSLSAGSGWTLTGPGIKFSRHLCVAGLQDSLQQELIHSRNRFPCGIDCFFTCDHTLVALPRSTQLSIDQPIDQPTDQHSAQES
ncbi:MAG: phosphonate C-P lyase system protein PhnH [Marinobacterium sp.]|nr:phosphonate C-P lyase system protein PhnH [Marinobacterium sp.]